MQLSRLVRDNATSTERAVRRLIHADASERLVPFDGFELVRAYWDGLPLFERARARLRRVESVTRERYPEDALPLVVGAWSPC